MKRLWAPWRMSYIEEIPTAEGCFFCEAAEARECSEENLVVFREELCHCMMNRFPYNNGHLLVAPNRHEGRLEDLTAAERAALFDCLVKAKELLGKVMQPDGYNVGLNLGRPAGAGVEDHLHFHIVPRWSGDTNFMPVFADVKIIPQALCQLHEKLRGALEATE